MSCNIQISVSDDFAREAKRLAKKYPRDLSAMQKAGLIRHEGKDNAGVWVVLEWLCP